MDNQFEFLVYRTAEEDISINAVVKDETIWLTQKAMGELFGVDKSSISRHLKNIFAEGELQEEVVVAKFATTTKHGSIEGKTQTHMIDCYNLDVIISVGYRVKSSQGVAFRKWANQVLKDYMIKGYAVNKKRLEYLEKTIKLIDIATRADDNLNGDEAKDILNVISNYSKALDLLDDYDHRTVKKIKEIGQKIKSIIKNV